MKKLRSFNESQKENTINEAIKRIVFFKEKSGFYKGEDKKWCSVALRRGIIEDVNQLLLPWEITIIDIEVAKILAKKYNIWGYD